MKVTITIDEAGVAKATVEGIKGSKCTDATKFLRDLGGAATEKKTAEYWEAERTITINRSR
jgi:hypothetical protein